MTELGAFPDSDERAQQRVMTDHCAIADLCPRVDHSPGTDDCLPADDGASAGARVDMSDCVSPFGRSDQGVLLDAGVFPQHCAAADHGIWPDAATWPDLDRAHRSAFICGNECRMWADVRSLARQQQSRLGQLRGAHCLTGRESIGAHHVLLRNVTCSQEAPREQRAEEPLAETARALHTLQTLVHSARNAVTVKRDTCAEKPMRPNDPARPAQAAPGRQRGHKAGAIVRAARLAAGLTLAELGQRCGYSASQVSRYERGIQPLTDITLLHRFAGALAIPPQALGLTPLDAARGDRHAGASLQEGVARTYGPNVSREFQPEGGEDPVRRRELLARAAGLAGAAALGLPAVGRAQPLTDQGGGLDNLLYGSMGAKPIPLAALRSATAQARVCFQTARDDQLTAVLSRLIATAAATRDSADGDEQAAASALLADAYIVAANFVIKLNDDPFAWTLADRALQAAQAGDDPLTIADGRRAVATVLRRTGRPAKARELLMRAVRDIEPQGCASPDQLSMYGTLLEVAAYTAAVDGNRPAASELIAEASAIATRLGGDANHRFTAFGPANVALYQVSIAQVLGDSGTAIEHAKTLRPAVIPTAERQGRYWIDVARAFHQWGKPEPCYRALLAAERAAPAEVRYRPPVHRIAEDLLRADSRSLPGLPAFARRIGVPAV